MTTTKFNASQFDLFNVKPEARPLTGCEMVERDQAQRKAGYGRNLTMEYGEGEWHLRNEPWVLARLSDLVCI